VPCLTCLSRDLSVGSNSAGVCMVLDERDERKCGLLSTRVI
jgi:hypothetical protein